jgi:hypothetical protein
MNIKFEHDKLTDVVFIDVTDIKPEGQISVKDVSDALGMRSQILARFDEQGNLLGLIIEDDKMFRREIRRKYVALKVDAIVELLMSKIAQLFAERIRTQHHAACAV